MTNSTQLQKEILDKQDTLNCAKTTLKKEFIGIDTIIDQVIDNISPWYMFPNLQDKPIVINLWGLTGVGKSSLVARISELIGFQKKYYHFDLGQSESKNNELWRGLEEIYDYGNGKPVMIALDEMQHAKTLNNDGSELKKDFTRIIWQLIDNGKFSITKNYFKITNIIELINQLQYLNNKNVRVLKGNVIDNEDLYYHFMEPKYFDINKNSLYFVPKSMYNDLYDLSKELYDTEYELAEELMKLNGLETIQLIKKILENAFSPKVVDCSKSLVFVLGNLDEAYTMSSDFNPDMSADDFHEKSLKITLPTIKDALKSRFRNEQIARLGNIHIIYPAFNSQSFKQIIQLELNKIVASIKSQFQITFQFDTTILKLIYAEGVFPTQGTRPIFTTIHQIIKSQISKIFTEIYLNGINVDVIIFTTKNNQLNINYYKTQNKVHQLKIPLNLSLEKLRTNKKDETQAICAVHESGHALLCMLLMNTVPEVVFSNTTEVDTGGFVYTKFKNRFVSKKDINKFAAIYLGGMAAEKLIFGDENITSGAENDIKKATDFVLSMLKSNGMGEIPAAYGDNISGAKLINSYKPVNNQAEKLLSDAFQLASQTLQQEEKLLLKMAIYLSNNRKLTHKQITDLAKKYATNKNILSLINENNNFYRNQLIQKIKLLESTPKNKKNITTFDFSLNNKLNSDC